LPSEPGGFNLPPNLPPSDVILPQDTPAPLNNRENAPLPPGRDSKDNSKPDAGAMQFKPESPRRGVSNQSAPNRNAGTGGMKTSMTRLPSTEPTAPAAEVAPLMNRSNPQANWDSALQQGVYAEASRAGSPYSPSEVAKQTNYQTPVAPNGNGRFSGEIVEQSYQQPHPEPQTSSAMPADSRPTVAPPVAMKGYCPVELNRGGRWVQGDPRWTVVYQGATYHLSGNEQRLLFLANPDQFAPANGGNDMVVTVNDHRTVPGDLSYCAAFKGRIYMFSSAATQMEFQKNPERFIGK
jgi:YHS domain-containing protein